jgi:hypothetical protein
LDHSLNQHQPIFYRLTRLGEFSSTGKFFRKCFFAFSPNISAASLYLKRYALISMKRVGLNFGRFFFTKKLYIDTAFHPH